MRIFNETNGCASLLSHAGKKLLTTTAMTAVGLLSLSGHANAGDGPIGDYDVWEFADGYGGTKTGESQGYVQYSGDRLIGDLVQEDIGRLGHVDLQANLTVATGVESGVMNILGRLTSTGDVFVLDVNGFLFGNGSVVDTVNFAAIGGTLGAGTDFDSADRKLDINVASDSSITIESGALVNVADAGLAAFVSPSISNSGVINAKMGTVAMAAGNTVTLDLYGDGLVEVAVDGELADGLIENSGQINANGGNVIVSAKVAKNAVDNVINMGGITTVKSFTQKGGKIILSGGESGTVAVTGTLEADGSNGFDAGEIEVAGENINVGQFANIRANSPSHNAGDISVIATNALNVDGNISAQGLAGTGDIETSAPTTTFGAGASVLATREWLLDPTNMTIDAILAGLIGNQLNIADMTVQTSGAGAGAGNLTLLNGANINKTSGAETTLNLLAHNDITIAGQINDLGGKLSVNLNADFDMSGGDADIFVLNDINTNGGTFTATASDDIDVKNGAAISTAGGNIDITSRGLGNGSWLWMPTGGAGTGTINTAGGDVNIKVDNINLASGSSIDAGTGEVTIKRDIVGTIGLGSGAGDMELTQDEIARISADTVTVGGNNTTDINVAGVDMSGFNTVNMSALAASSINYFGVNNFVALNAVTDEITLGSGSSVNATNSIFFDAPLVNLDGNLSAPSISGTATTVNVNNNGNIPVVNEEIQDGVDVAASGATVNVGAGTFTESVLIDRAITILGSGRTNTFVTSGSASQNAFTVDGDFTNGSGNAGRVGLFRMDVSDSKDGVEVRSTATNLNDVLIGGASFTDNALTGVRVTGNSVSRTLIQNTNFLDNGAGGGSAGEGDILFFLHNGDIELKNVDIQNNSPAGTADYGIQIRGASALAPSGSISFDNVKVAGNYRAGQVGIQEYNGIGPVTMNDVVLGGQTDALTDSSGWASLYLSNLGTGDIDIANTSFLGGNLDHIWNITTGDVDATGATFEGVAAADLTALESFDVEDKVFHKMDFAPLGLVTWKDGEVFVTSNTLGIQHGIDISDAGDTVNVDGSTYQENLLIDKSIKLSGFGTTLEYDVAEDGPGRGGDNKLITVTAADVDIDPFTFDGLGIANYGVHAAGAGAAGLVVDGNTFKNFNEAGVFVAHNGAATGTIKNNTFEGSSTRGVETGTLNGGYTLDITDNTIGTDGDEVLNGLLFGQVRDATVNISGGSIDAGGGTGSQDGDAIHFKNGTYAGAEVHISDITVVSDGDEAIDFQNTVRTGSTVNITGGSHTGGNNGIEFGGIDGEVNITGTTIDGQGADKRGINLLGAIKGALKVATSTITGGDDGIGSNDAQNNTVDGGTFEVTSSTVTGTNGDGIELGAVKNGAIINISNNIGISGDDNGVHFVDGVDGSTITIANNTSISGGNNGILFGEGSPSISGSTVDVSSNTIHGDNDGIHVEGEITDSTVTIGKTNGEGNTITAGAAAVGNGTLHDGIYFGGNITGATRLLVGWNNIDSLPTTGGGATSFGDMGIRFDGFVNTSVVGTSGVGIVGNEISAGQGGEDRGISFWNGIGGNSTIRIAGNTIEAGDDGIGVFDIYDTNKNQSIRDDAHLIISGNTIGTELARVGNANNGDGNGIDFQSVTGNSQVQITGNNIWANKNAIEFDKVVDTTFNEALSFGVEIQGNTNINAENEDGIQFAQGINGSSVLIASNGSIVGGAGDGIFFGGGSPSLEGAFVIVSNNDEIKGSKNGIQFEEEVTAESDVQIFGNNVEGLSENGIVFNGDIDNSNIDITGNNIEGNQHGVIAAGIELSGDTTINVDNNTKIAATNGNGVWIGDNTTGGATISVSGNDDVSAGTTGILLENAVEATIDGNTVDNTGNDGIRISGGNNNDVTSNLVGTNGGANNIGEDGIHINGSNGALVQGNTVQNTVANGILVNPSNNVTIANNDIYGVGLNGLRVEGGTGFNIYGNTFIGTGENGISLFETGISNIYQNLVLLTGGHGISGEYGLNTNITNNIVGLTYGNGIHLSDTYFTNVINNLVGLTYGNGISVYGGESIDGYFTNITGNKVALTGENGIVVDGIYGGGSIWAADSEDGFGFDYNGPAVNIHNNEVALNGGHGIAVYNSGMTKITYNDVFAAGLAFKDLLSGDNDFLINHRGLGFEWGNGDGIHVENVESQHSGRDYRPDLIVSNNNVSWTGGHGISAEKFGKGYISYNTVKNTGIDGTFWGWGTVFDQLELLYNNQDRVINGGLNALVGNGNLVTYLKRILPAPDFVEGSEHDGIHINKFDAAWLAYNNVSNTADDGISATKGNFVSIYNNYVDLSGYLPIRSGNNEVGKNANGIFVSKIGAGDIPEMDVEVTGFGSSSYGMAAEIYGNEVANSEDDGIQVEDSDSAYIGHNIVGHTGDDGVDVDNTGIVIVRDNAISSTEDHGITIHGGRYAGVFDNRVLLTGDDGIHVGGVYGGQDAKVLGDIEYGYGWSVNVSGNEVAMVENDGIEVHESGPTKVAHNKVFMAGMGEDLGDVIETINDFANETSRPRRGPRVSVDDYYNGFEWSWGDGHGINVHDIEGAYYSPNGWAADIRGNHVRYTGGHGILAEDNDRTRIANNRVRYSGIDYTGFHGAHSMLEALSNGPFDRENEGRRDLWQADGSMIRVLDGYFGINEEPTDETPYVTISDVDFDSHDGIHAENINGRYEEGLSGRNYLYDLKIKGNDVRRTGDDGIEVNGAGRTLIAENTVRHSGFGDDKDYGSGDEYGADGIHVRNVSAEINSGNVPVRFAGQDEETEGYDYESARNYALIIRNNDVRNTADDGIEVVGDGEFNSEAPLRAAGVSGDGSYDGPYFYGHTDRVLIAENTVRRSGVVENNYESEWSGPNTGPDGNGHDGIHVRGIQGDQVYYYTDITRVGNVGSGESSGYYGYAVDIIDNDVRRTGDDGIEVINSASTLILDNTVRHSGVGGGDYYGGADYHGADGIHVRNVGGFNDKAIMNTRLSGSSEAGDIFQPYAVVIDGNDVRRTQDDGIEVVGNNFIGDGGCGGDGFPCGDGSCISGDGDGWSGDGFPGGTGRTLIKNNLVRGAGTYFDLEGPETLSYFYGDGFGADGIHVSGVQNFFGKPIYDGPIDAVQTSSGGPYGYYGYDVQIIGNDVKNVADDGIEVIGAPFSQTNVLVERNVIENSGDNGIALVSNGGFIKRPQKDVFEVSLINPFGGMNSDIVDNVVTNSENNGLFVQGGNHDEVNVSGNEFTDFDIGAHFESGLIDLTGEGNTFTGGRVGMRFSPAIVGFEYPEIDTDTLAFAELLGDPIYAPMALVDDDGPGGFGGTIGAQTFNGQSQFYVELDNGAFFDPGTPTLLNALDSTYVGTPFGTVTPSVDFPAGFTVEQLAFFEDKFYHFNDDGSLGLFFFPLLPEIDQEDIFQFFGPNASALSGLNVTILGLPGIPGNPVALNSITPAAGGDGGTDPASLNAIETAAGGEEATCWGDAVSKASSGQAVSLNYSGSAEDLLNGEASCGS